MLTDLKLRIKQTHWNLLSTSTQDRLLDLTFKNSGTMRHFTIERKPNVFIAYGYSKEKNLKGNRVGWAVYDPVSAWTMFFTSKQVRECGVATQLMQTIVNYVEENDLPIPRVCGWDTKSELFFKEWVFDNKATWGNYIHEVQRYHQRNYKWRKR